MSSPHDPFSFDAGYGDPSANRAAADPNRPPSTGAEWKPNGRAADAEIVRGNGPTPFEDLDDELGTSETPPADGGSDPAPDFTDEFAAKPAGPGDQGPQDSADDRKAEAPLIPDREALLQFAKLMFRNASPDGFVSLRAFRDNDRRDEKPILIEAIRLDDPDFAAILFERARQAAAWDDPAVFCPPVATFKTPRNAKTDNLHEGVDLSMECDQSPQAARSTLEALLGPATAAVESGGEWMNPETGELEPKVHLHWRLNKPTSTKAEHDLLKEARTLAANLVGGDGTNKSVVHPIRWPGSWHRKKSPRLAKIVAFSDDNEIDLAEAVERLRDAAGAATFTGFGFKTGSKLGADDQAAVASALSVIPNDNLAWNDWNRIGMATWAATDGSEVGREAFAKWSAKASKNDPIATESRWQHYKTSPPTRIGFGTLVYLARLHSPGWSYGRTEDYSAEFAVEVVDPIDLWAKFDPPTLPRGLLPQVIEDFAFDQGMAMGGDMSGIAVGALAVCAAAIPDKIQLRPKRHDTGWHEAARLWVALVGPVSAMKSPILRTVARPLRAIDAEMARKNQHALAEYNKLSKEEKQQTEPPRQTRLMMQDTTIEAAQEILKDSPNGVLCYQDELSGWFGSMDKYSNARGGAKDRAFWLEAYNGGPYTVSRIGRGSVFIENLSVSLLGGIQPEIIRKLAGDSVDDGLLQRLIPIVLRPAVVGRDEEPSQAVAEYKSLIGKLHHIGRPIMGGGMLERGATLQFDDGALTIRKQLEQRHLELQQCESINRKLAAHIGKYNGMFARLCVVWHCIEHAGRNIPASITEATARRVKGFLHGFLLPHALAFYAGTLGLSDDHDRLAAVAGYILAHKLPQITNRDVQRGDRTMRNLTRRETEVIFEQLDAFGWVTRTPGLRPSDPPHWIVNPVVHRKFAERGKAEAERRERDRAIIGEMLRGTAP